MNAVASTNQFGQAVVTTTLSDEVVIEATVTNRFNGHAHPGGGEVEVSIHGGRLSVLSFNHTWAQGAAGELAIVIQNAYGAGQQAGRAAAEGEQKQEAVS